MNLALAKTDMGDAARGDFARACARLPGPAALNEARRAAFDSWQRSGLPHRRIEDWKYTDLRVLMREVLPLAAATDADALARVASVIQLHAIDGARRLVLADGVFAPSLSDLGDLETGLRIRSLQEVLAAGDAGVLERLLAPGILNPMLALNCAMMTDGVVIEIADGAKLARPLHLLHVGSGARAAMFTRSVLTLGQGASATLIESCIGEAAAYQLHDALVIGLGDGARLDQVRLVEDGREAFNISSSLITLGADAHLNTFGMVTGALVSRYQAVISIAGERSRVETNGVNLLNGRQHADTTLVMNHAVPDCVSREVFRAVLDDRGHSVFQGRINVHQVAQKTDARMMTRALLLSDEAEADNKPELEIFADDVQCGHGATCGALDDALLFYLRARGLSEKQAQALLIQAFVGEAIESIADDALRDLAMAAASRWLEARA